ncbi:hypothetical protein L195_g007854 [Trifolium pratense]|uniref:Uncharacterized protein n=1 Tax=Trifolium pratense TaxID=57577 RepID=A0A2K3P7J7_TRIPR|nr:hypothetical protein L195_g007854 [Trifolium pratense]
MLTGAPGALVKRDEATRLVVRTGKASSSDWQIRSVLRKRWWDWGYGGYKDGGCKAKEEMG